MTSNPPLLPGAASTAEEFWRAEYDKTTDTRRRRSLENVQAACDHFDQAKKKITVEAIGDYCQDHLGGPKAQSIRNSKEVLEKYVKLRAGQGLIARNTKAVDLAALIDNEIARADYLRLVEQERLNREKLERLTKAFRYLNPIDADELLAELFGGPQREAAALAKAASPGVIDAEALKALHGLFDPKRLARCALKLHHNAIVSDITGDELLSADEAAALQRLMGAADPPSFASSFSLQPPAASIPEMPLDDLEDGT